MSSLNDNDISNIINQELSDDLDGASASETEDFVEEDDVQSDENFEPSDSEESHISTPRDPSSTLQHDQASSSSSMAPETSSSSIIQLPQRNIRSKNRHVWATTKGHTSVRRQQTADIKCIIRTWRRVFYFLSRRKSQEEDVREVPLQKKAYDKKCLFKM